MFQSQAGGYRHRREGLQHRLFLNEKNDVWTPKKRFNLKKENRRRAKIYENRIDLRNISFDSKFYNDVEKFQAEIADQIKLNDELNKPGLFKRLKFKFKQVINKFKKMNQRKAGVAISYISIGLRFLIALIYTNYVAFARKNRVRFI